MIGNQYEIWIEAEEWATGEWDIHNGNTDVIVEFEDNKRWIASFYTYSNIVSLVEKNKQNDECMNVKYFWSRDMILVDEISRERIEEVIKHLLDQGNFKSILREIGIADEAD